MVTNTEGKRNNVIQNLDTPMVPGEKYTLKVNVGQRSGGSRTNFAGYQIRLLSGGSAVKTVGSLTAPGEQGSFGEVTLTYVAKTGNTGNLGVQFGSGTNAGPGAAVDFDNVRLSVGDTELNLSSSISLGTSLSEVPTGTTSTLENTSFEDTSVGSGVSRDTSPWTVTGSTDNTDVGIFRPNSSIYSSGVSGNNVLYMVSNVAGKRNNVVQRLNRQMEPGQTYTLTVDVGRRSSGRSTFAGYQICLLSGNRFVKQVSSLSGPNAGTFKTIPLTYTAKAGDTGQIGVQFGSGTNAGSGASVDFDNVRLSVGSTSLGGNSLAVSALGASSGTSLSDVPEGTSSTLGNPSFDDISVGSGVARDISPWTEIGSSENTDVGVFKPSSSVYTSGVTGSNVLYMVSNTAGTRNNIVQRLNVNMKPGQTYYLTVDVGRRGSGRSTFAGYQIRLLSGNTPVRIVGSLSGPAAGTFKTIPLTYTAQAGDTGQIGVQIGSGTNAGPGAAVDFDNVQLSVGSTSLGGVAQTSWTATKASILNTGNSALSVNLSDRQVVQRSLSNDTTDVKFTGSCAGTVKTIQLKVTDLNNATNTSSWIDIAKPTSTRYEGSYALSTGWYEVSLRSLNANGQVLNTITIDHIGVGDVFITAGQSNSANFGQRRQTAMYEEVSWCNVIDGTWSHAADGPGNPSYDPDGGGKGSYWPILGDYIANDHNIPCAFAVVGDGGSNVYSWTPDHPQIGTSIQETELNYHHLNAAISLLKPTGFRAILWHQGEADLRTSDDAYAAALTKVIEQSREDAGWTVPWYVSLVVRPIGQEMVISSISGVHKGADTDSLTGSFMRYDGVHFSEMALNIVADQWFGAVYGGEPSGRGTGELTSSNITGGFGGSNQNVGGSNTGQGQNIVGVTNTQSNNLTITTTSLPVAQYGSQYVARISCSNNTGDVTWQIGPTPSELVTATRANPATLICGLEAFRPGSNNKLRLLGYPIASSNHLMNNISEVKQTYTVVATDSSGATASTELELTVDLSTLEASNHININLENIEPAVALDYYSENIYAHNHNSNLTWQIRRKGKVAYKTISSELLDIGQGLSINTIDSQMIRVHGVPTLNESAGGITSKSYMLRVTDSSGKEGNIEMEIQVDHENLTIIQFEQLSLNSIPVDRYTHMEINTFGGTGKHTWEVWLDDTKINPSSNTGAFSIIRNLVLNPQANSQNLNIYGNYYRTDEEFRDYKADDTIHTLKLKVTDEEGNVAEKTYDLTIDFPNPYNDAHITLAYIWNNATRDELDSNSNVVSEILQGYSKVEEAFDAVGVSFDIGVYGYTEDYGAGSGTDPDTIYDDMNKIISGTYEGGDVEFRRLTYSDGEVIGHAYYDGPTLRETFNCNMTQFVFDRNDSAFSEDPNGIAGLQSLFIPFSIVSHGSIDETTTTHEFGHNFGCEHNERWRSNRRRFSVMRSVYHKSIRKNYFSDKNWYTSQYGWMGDEDQSNVDYIYMHKNIISTNLD